MRTIVAFVIAMLSPVAISFAAQGHATSSASPALTVKAVSIYFDNRRPEITVNRASEGVSAKADISTAGSGVLEGYWELDGRVVNRVSQHVTGVGAVTLTTQKSPDLPVTTPGSHIVRFVVTNPATVSPSALLFVVPEGASSVSGDLALLQPADGADLVYAQATFRWEGRADSTTYLVSFHRSAQGKPIFAAYTQGTSYTLPERALKKNFRPGKKYFWRVACFDTGGHAICSPKRQGFGFKK